MVVEIDLPIDSSGAARMADCVRLGDLLIVVFPDGSEREVRVCSMDTSGEVSVDFPRTEF